MKVDTGAAVSVILFEETYKELSMNLSLKKTSVSLNTYTGERIPVLGEIEVEATYQEQSHQFSLMVLKGKGHNLFGRNFLIYFRLDWKTIALATLENPSAKVGILFKKHEDVFSGNQGTMKHFCAKLSVKKDAQPIFLKPRSVPFAILQAIEEELKWLEAAGIIENYHTANGQLPLSQLLREMQR